MTGSRSRPKGPAASVAFFSGEDAFALDRAVAEMARALSADGGEVGGVTVWWAGADGAETTLQALEDASIRVSSGSLFGGGTLVAVRQPLSVLRERAPRERLLALLTAVAPGNGLAFVELVAPGTRATATAESLRAAVTAAGGTVKAFPALSRDKMERWVEGRATELGVRLGPGAARVLAERVGAYVREGDVDRRRQAQAADSELQKLALYRPDGVVSPEDVAALVGEAVPASTWAFLDAVGLRRTSDASGLAERLLLEGSPIQVVVAQLHRRLRELLIIREHLAEGARPSDLPRLMKLQPFRAEKLSEQARAWAMSELEAALEGLYALDLAGKGLATDGSIVASSEDRVGLALQVWVAERVRRPVEAGSRQA